MAPSETIDPFSGPLDERLLAVARAASVDADRLVAFLDGVGLAGSLEKPRFLPASFLLRLAAALRFYFWECDGHFFHRDAGLPEAKEIIRQVFATALDRSIDPRELNNAAIRLSLQHFAWHAMRDVQAEVVIDGELDDAALDALAEFIWNNRSLKK